ncbi:acylneuraminate cytidylyltransferase family protein [Fodinicurvata sp. EGI_FJ10296]|uniref:acylneuraminate cytidylyltransferase family protein n=1 Tax=Fodinicurvata sp. EGI_FJ10296 TaxID=3231908 RepID=UPI00345681F2
MRIAVICARGGSKGVPGKNIRPFAGKPLIAWSIEQARQSGCCSIVAVSSDSADILDAARSAGADLLVERPPELATDTVSSLPAVVHCVKAAENHLGRECDSILYLQATSPLRMVTDIQGAVALHDKSRPGSVITGCEARNSPYFTLLEETAAGGVALSKTTVPPVVRRQDAPRCYDMNGSIYVFTRSRFIESPKVLYEDTRLYEMPPERSVDIDTELDWILAEVVADRYGFPW